jgi:hypothetical protein
VVVGMAANPSGAHQAGEFSLADARHLQSEHGLGVSAKASTR